VGIVMDNWKDNIDWEATYEKNIDHFWKWAIDEGFCEDYILDNQSRLEDMWVEHLDENDIVWNEIILE
jgi:hypothetical protein